MLFWQVSVAWLLPSQPLSLHIHADNNGRKSVSTGQSMTFSFQSQLLVHLVLTVVASTEALGFKDTLNRVHYSCSNPNLSSTAHAHPVVADCSIKEAIKFARDAKSSEFRTICKTAHLYTTTLPHVSYRLSTDFGSPLPPFACPSPDCSPDALELRCNASGGSKDHSLPHLNSSPQPRVPPRYFFPLPACE